MKFRAISFIIMYALASIATEAQNDLNAYKYVIVPNKYEFQRFDDQYQLNSLTQFLFNKQGFSTLKIDDRPNDLYDNSCLGVTVDVINTSSMFTTKVMLELKDCNNNVVYKSEEGRSKLKDYKKGYHEAIRKAFESVKELDYKFDSSTIIVANEVEKSTKEVVIDPQTETVKNVEVVTETSEIAVENPVNDGDKNSTIELKEPIKIAPAIVVVSDEVEKSTEKITGYTLYAQTTSVGYQLVDNTPKVVFILLKSSKEDYYFLKNKSGVVFKENEKWYAEYYNENKLVKEELHIKF